MAYLALYREWRPKNFREIVGQEHVKTSLANAVFLNKVAHAYLFSGPRGTGKTTAAKILAKALNCENRDGAEPCNQCTSCKSIDLGNAMDVMEIDAASNRGIDEIRDLREKVKLAAASGKFKIYIIDEVHMLTAEAFNALLKTLEEPPQNVVFVMATTEAHKVPLTILSRVQRFEFHRISVAEITARLQQVSQSLGRNVEDRALQLIARKAEGGLRDALGILDQCLLQDDPVGLEQVYQVIGMVGESFSADLTDALLEGNYGTALARLSDGIALGRDPRQIMRELLDYLRQLLLFSAGGIEPLVSAEIMKRLVAQSRQAGLERLLAWINTFLKGEAEFRFTTNARLTAEMILIQAIHHEAADSSAGSTSTSASANTVIVPKPKPKPERQPADTPKPNNQDQSVHAADNRPGTTDKRAEKPLPNNLFADLMAKWPQVLDEVRKKKRSTHAFLLEGKPGALNDGILSLVFKEGYSFHRDKFNQAENKAVVEEVVTAMLGAKVTLLNLMENEFTGSPAQPDVPAEAAPLKEGGSDNNAAINGGDDGCIDKAIELFGADLVQVKNNNA